MRYLLGFSQASDDRLLVTVEPPSLSRSTPSQTSRTAFGDENIFICRVVTAYLAEQEIIDIITNVLLAFSSSPEKARKVPVELTDDQLKELALVPSSVAIAS